MTILHLHLDVCGGIAGDMFAAAIVDACPELRQPLLDFLHQLDLSMSPTVTLKTYTDQVLCGHQFQVAIADDAHEHEHHHHHTHWSEIRQWLMDWPMDEKTRRHSLGIFALLAQAEANVHGKDVDAVCFHEVGAWDSIIDVLAAGWLIAHLDKSSWSVSSLPWGGGLAKTDHGLIPVPAPATVELLRNFTFFDDGVSGERITPTGAAILAWLQPSANLLSGRLTASGHGFGTRSLPGMSNVLRVNILDRGSQAAAGTVVVMECDIDDQSPEALAVGIESLREMTPVIDVVQTPVYGKKGRITTQLRLLVKPGQQQLVAESLFIHTTTLGVRWYLANRFELPRQHGVAAGIRVKYAQRPGIGRTIKAEMDDIASHGTDHHHRESLRRQVEETAARELPHEH